jgi:hypothetical protein
VTTYTPGVMYTVEVHSYKEVATNMWLHASDGELQAADATTHAQAMACPKAAYSLDVVLKHTVLWTAPASAGAVRFSVAMANSPDTSYQTNVVRLALHHSTATCCAGACCITATFVACTCTQRGNPAHEVGQNSTGIPPAIGIVSLENSGLPECAHILRVDANPLECLFSSCHLSATETAQNCTQTLRLQLHSRDP